MSKNTPAVDPNSAAAFIAAANAAASSLNPFSGGATAGGAGSNVPGVSSTNAGDVIQFTLPNQPIPDFASTNPSWTQKGGTVPGVTNEGAPTGQNVTSDYLTQNPDGSTSITFQNWMSAIRSLYLQNGTLQNLQSQLAAAGFIKAKGYVPTGVLDQTTLTAWRQFGLSMVSAPKGTSAASILAMGTEAPTALRELQAIQGAINKAQASAAGITNANVTLTDPNKVAQTYATAMESMGMGVPTPEQTQKFVAAFHTAEVNATVDQQNADKTNYLAGSQNLITARNDIQKGGNLAAAQTALNEQGGGLIGPTMLATKAAPNLDSEAIAAAQANDPAQYTANDMTYGYSLLQRMLGGELSLPSTPTSPTSLTTSGGIVTSPLPGA